jgi:hypothetical protein
VPHFGAPTMKKFGFTPKVCDSGVRCPSPSEWSRLPLPNDPRQADPAASQPEGN